MQAQQLIDWADAGNEFVGFLASFFAIGAIGFRFVVLRHSLLEHTEFHRAASVRAATIGLLGTIVTAIYAAIALPHSAERAHQALGAFLAGNNVALAEVIALGCAILGFLLVMGRVRAGWWLAGAGVIVVTLRNAFGNDWLRLINPMHRLAGGLWIGTLFVLVMAGLVPILAAPMPPEQRGTIAADMVNSFSPFALGSAFVLVMFGVWTAWRHLKRPQALWTTPYGYALIGKLFLVMMVFALGAWNWRRQRPMLGSEDAAHAIRRSARWELTIALLVLMVTGILVSLPTPKLPH